MKKWMMVVFFVGLGVALAQNLQAASRLFDQGKFEAAATAAVALKTSDGYSLAAKSLYYHAWTLALEKRDEVYGQGEAHARQAIQQNKNNAEGYYELARTLARLSQIRGVLTALSQGYGSQIRENLETAIALERSHAGAISALALWHGVIASRGVGWLYGADGARAMPLCEQALRLEPNVILHRVECASAIMLADENRNKPKAIEWLEFALKLKADMAAEKIDQDRARRNLVEYKK
jgi:tetratricopeptide (TPR) repeat protein